MRLLPAQRWPKRLRSRHRVKRHRGGARRAQLVHAQALTIETAVQGAATRNQRATGAFVAHGDCAVVEAAAWANFGFATFAGAVLADVVGGAGVAVFAAVTGERCMATTAYY